MPTLLFVHHTVSPTTQELFEAARAGAGADGLDEVQVEVRPALSASVADVLGADGFLIGTTANIGYLSGATKYFFDTVYYPCLSAKPGAPYGLYVHGGNDTTGAVRAATSIAKAMGWRTVAEPVEITGPVTKPHTEAVWELAATTAASLL